MTPDQSRSPALLLPLAPMLLTRAFVAAFNHAIRGQKVQGRLSELEGKRIGIRAAELPSPLEVEVVQERLRAAGPGGTAHVVVRGSLADLCRLAMRSEDPDTLFFERRLSIEGETDTGLLVKNLLDAFDWDWEAHVRSVLSALLADVVLAADRPVRAALREIRTRPMRSP